MYSPNIPRCQHIKTNGTQCESPALACPERSRTGRNRFCYFHKKWHDQRVVINSARVRRTRAALDLPVLEDADSVQVGLMQVMRLTLTGQLDSKTAGLMLYALQTASLNLRRTNFEPLIKTDIVIDPRRVDETLLGEDVWENEDFEDEEEGENEHPEPVAGEKGFAIQAVATLPPWATRGRRKKRRKRHERRQRRKRRTAANRLP
jgi:hypothetical protein